MESLHIAAYIIESTYMAHLVNSGWSVVVPCVGLFGLLTYYFLIFISEFLIKTLIYDTTVDNAEELVIRIAVTA